MTVLEPGATIGVFGGGQLGRMLALAAARFGFDVAVFSPEKASPAGRVAAHETVAAYDDADAVAAFARTCDVVTYEFENIDMAAIETAKRHATIHPSPAALAIARDRLNEKTFARECGAGTAQFAVVDTLDDLQRAVAEIATPAILKTRTQGYDGKGQARLERPSDADAAWGAIKTRAALLEAMVPFDREVSLISARAADGQIIHFDLAENDHENGVLRETQAPAIAAQALTDKARAIMTAMLERLDYVGVLTIEFFVIGEDLLVNELAPRVHNSGHWTIEGADTDQFAQHIRAIAGWPLGPTTARGRWRMRNLLGEEIHDISTHRKIPGVHPHHYGKREVDARRKMGHITVRETTSTPKQT